MKLASKMNQMLEEDRRLALLVKAVRSSSDLLSYQISDIPKNRIVLENADLMGLFRQKKHIITSIVILQEFIKETACMLAAKDLANNMVEEYEAASKEDARLEAAFACFKSGDNL